jgi:hypothetical protein
MVTQLSRDYQWLYQLILSLNLKIMKKLILSAIALMFIAGAACVKDKAKPADSPLNKTSVKAVVPPTDPRFNKACDETERDVIEKYANGKTQTCTTADGKPGHQDLYDQFQCHSTIVKNIYEWVRLSGKVKGRCIPDDEKPQDGGSCTADEEGVQVVENVMSGHSCVCPNGNSGTNKTYDVYVCQKQGNLYNWVKSGSSETRCE